jgi:hypothetical protein
LKSLFFYGYFLIGSYAWAAESAYLDHRLSQPQSHFLLDGLQGFIADPEFYSAQADESVFLWYGHPFLKYGNDRAWVSDSGNLIARANLGNEIGDGMLQDLTESRSLAKDNRTPLTAGEISWLAKPGLRLHASLDQNDHFSYSSLPGRIDMIGESQRDEMAYIGGNVPLKSQVSGGVAFTQDGGLWAGQFNQGFWWTTSPLSGRSYPWKGRNADFFFKPNSSLEFFLLNEDWRSPAPGKFFQASWHRSEFGASLSCEQDCSWNWNLVAGVQHRELQSDSIFNAFYEWNLPIRFTSERAWTLDRLDRIKLSSVGNAGIRDRMLLIRQNTVAKASVDSHLSQMSLQTYIRHRLKGFVVPVEFFPEDSTWLAVSNPGKYSSGLSYALNYTEKGKIVDIGLAMNYALEWAAPIFQTEFLEYRNGQTLRSGSYNGSSYVLQNGSTKAFLTGSFGSMGLIQNWKLDVGMREFWGRDAAAMEFLPSRVWAGGAGTWNFPSDLEVDFQVHFIGKKEVRGWGPVFKVPAHFENNLAIHQRLLDNSMKLSFSALHAFGDDIREQPNGNPLRFRVLAGLEAQF